MGGKLAGEFSQKLLLIWTNLWVVSIGSSHILCAAGVRALQSGKGSRDCSGKRSLGMGTQPSVPALLTPAGHGNGRNEAAERVRSVQHLSGANRDDV